MKQDFASRRSVGTLWLLVVTSLIAAVVLFWWSSYHDYKGVRSDQISIRQNDDKIQYRYLDGDWVDIVSLAVLTGADGEDGDSGQSGRAGSDGVDGAPGPKGNTGTPGRDGQNGVPGTDGQDGAPGVRGATGPRGDKGEVGDRGADGIDGQDGIEGRQVELQKTDLYIQWRYEGDADWNNVIALTELKGDKGDMGEQGLPGEAGAQGVQGTEGPQGLQGVPGIPGEMGPPGAVPTSSDYMIVGPGRPDQPATTGGIVSTETPVGATYTSTDGAGVGAHVWRKRPSGAWVVTDGDTGWRDITSEITYTETEWDPWTLSVRRKADDGVTVRLTTTWLGGLGAPSAPANTTLWSPTAGWRIDHTGITSGVRKGFTIGSMIYDSQSGQQKGKYLTHTWDTGDGRFRDIRVTGGAITSRDVGYITYPTNDAWPTALPGN